jgi:hypothetical protein
MQPWAVKVTKLRIDGQAFYLPPDTDLIALQEQILEAVRGRAAFVSFSPVGHGDISVLVTPSIPIRFETEEHTAEEIEQWDEDPPSIDVFHEL